jgi:hypothetical protein
VQEYLKKRKQRIREEDEKRRASESKSLKLLTLGITFASMTLGLSFIPLFPQPLPVIIALLIVLGAYTKPEYSMPVGGLMIGLGMMYHLASKDFIAMLGPPEVRVAVITVLLYLFVALPIRFRSCEDAIAINIGIMAATLLFFNQTYIFAVPLLLTVAVLFKKTQGGLALSYYAMISVPFQIIQFSEIIPTIQRVEWWLDPLGVPPLYVPLNEVFNWMQDSMAQFRLFDASKVVSEISSQLTSSPAASASKVGSALSQYLDSFPGIILFLALVLCLIFVVSTIASEFSRKSFAMRAEIIFPALGAAGLTALFYLLVIVMQRPLAFRAQVNTVQIATGILMTILFALPLSYVNYAPKKRALIEERSKRVVAKTQELTAKLQAFEALLNKAKTIPADVGSPEGDMLVIKDKLSDIIVKTAAKLYDPSELDAKFHEMNEQISSTIDGLTPELGKVVEEYQLRVNYEYTTWLKKLKALGFEAKTAVKADFQKDMPLEARIDNIREILETSRVLANEVSQTVEQTYSIIRTLYDQTLPEQSRTITFARQQLKEKTAPWFATDSLFTAMTNWKALYNRDVSKSVEYLLDSLKTLISLNVYAEKLQPALGDRYEKIMDCRSRAEDIRRSIKDKTLTVANLPFIKDALETSLGISMDVLLTLHELMETKEASIENLLPVNEAFWEKNVALRERTAFAIKAIAEAPKQELNKTMAELPKALSQISECIDTLVVYSDKEELLLNYPVAKTAIEELLRQKKRVSAEELPFELRYAEEYLKLFYSSQRSREFSFDEANMMLVKKK